MFGARFRQVAQSVASSSSSRALHTSSVQHAPRSANQVHKQNVLQQAQRAKEALSDRPSVVLGTRPSEEAAKWAGCKLAKILVDEEALVRGDGAAGVEAVSVPVGTLALPKQLAFGVGADEKELLFAQLPQLSTEAATGQDTGLGERPRKLTVETQALFEAAQKRELAKAQHLSRVIDLRNTNAAGLAFENRKRIVLAFSTPANPYDTGRAEVQAALKTYQIRKLYKHLVTFKRDVGNRLGLRKLVHERAKILRYLRNTNRDRYETVLEQLALEPEAVEGELVV